MQVTAEELRSRLEYNPETGLLYWKKGSPRAGKEAFTTVNTRGYKATTFRPRNGPATTLSAHRAAWAIHYGEFPSGIIDHINGDKTDNRIKNLRDVTNAENARNSALGRKNKSGVLGVFVHKQTGKWCAQISAFGKHVGLGLFSSQSDAIIARKAAERVLGYHPNHGRPIKQNRGVK
jgi:hypothetical protein